MNTRKLAKAEWQPYLDRVSKWLIGKRAEVDVESLGLGDQVAAEWLPLLGVVYDPKSDAIEIALDGYDHLIRRPREVYLEVDGGQIQSLEIVDAEDTRQIVKLKDPLMLPAPSSENS